MCASNVRKHNHTNIKWCGSSSVLLQYMRDFRSGRVRKQCSTFGDDGMSGTLSEDMRQHVRWGVAW
jgi:hypothetical protein